MKYVGKDSLTYFWSKIKDKLALKQDTITSTNKLDYGLLDNTPTIPTKTSELTNDTAFMSGMTVLSYGISTWNDFITAYGLNHLVYCKASSGSNPASGAQTRRAFMAYVNNDATPTEVEFQYYRTLSTHTETNQGDEVHIYTLNKSTGWKYTVRKTYTKIETGTGMTYTFTAGNTPKIKLEAKEPYNTTESLVGNWLGNNLYRKVFSVAAFPNTAEDLISTSVSNATIVNMYGYATNGNESYPLNCDNPTLGGKIYTYTTDVGSNLYYGANFDASAYSGNIVIEYIKNS